jgi:3-hydroxyisobutyrate dehydrogenase-like beta-hydroxyacid dehydrogenase
MTTVGLVHPGAMGATVGGACAARVIWCSEGRSADTVARADRWGLEDVGTLEALVAQSDTVVSVCPPASAPDVAEHVAALGFVGRYVDANAIAPATAREIAGRFERFVDGGIVGPPADRAGTTRFYLSGPEAADVARMWSTGALDARVIDGGPGAASALKMAFATWTKVSSALLLDVRALARAEGVEAALLAEWGISMPDSIARSERTAAGVGPKAWRFVGEMEQMVRAFTDAGLPDGFARGAAELYERLAPFKDADDVTLDAVLAELLARRSPG